MFEKIRDTLNEVIEIANKCPEKYQIKCFEILLDALVTRESTVMGAVTGVPTTITKAPKQQEPTFFSTNQISPDEWKMVFHFDGNFYKIIVKDKDLKDKNVSKKQVKLGLLLGIKSLLETQEPIIPKEELINICKQYSAYDSANFATHMKNQKNLFISKDKNTWSLTVLGQERAAEVIKELAQ